MLDPTNDDRPDSRCPICLGLWSPFPCPYDLSVTDE